MNSISAAVRSYGVVQDAGLALQLEKLCSTTGVTFESFPGYEILLDELKGARADFLIADCGSWKCEEPLECSLPVFIGKVRKIVPGIPILLLLPPFPDEEIKNAVLEAGVTDFMSLPLSSSEFTMRVRSLAQIAISSRQYTTSSRAHEQEIRTAIGEIMLREYETLYVLGKAAEYKDRETGSHIARVAHYSRLIARMIGVPEGDQDAVFHASALHDIGKLGIPDSVLLKPGKLSDVEFDVMKTHSMIGHGILKNSQSSYLLTGAMIALTHHERFDGTGYPMKLKGEEIPLYGRIVGIADVFDALTTKRPYKEPWPLYKAFELVAKERSRHFDPVLVDAFLSNALGVEDIYYNHSDAEVVVGDL